MNPSYRLVKYAAIVPVQLSGDRPAQAAYLRQMALDEGVIVELDATVTETPLKEPPEWTALEGQVLVKMLRIEADGYCTHQTIHLDHDVHAVNAASQVGPIIWLGEIRASCSNCHHRFLLDGRSVMTVRLTPSDRLPE